MSKFAAINSKSIRQVKVKVPKVLTNQEMIDAEVARAVQQLLSIQREDQAQPDNYVSEPRSSLLTPTEETFGNIQTDTGSFKTPENELSPSTKQTNGKKHNKRSTKRTHQSQLSGQGESTFDVPEHDQLEGLLQNSPKRGRNELQITNGGKRNLKEVLALPNEGTNAKYQKIGHDEGTIISAYYTQGHEEKVREFKPVYVNVGNPNQAKELIGIKPNTKFVNLVKKPVHDAPNYLVLAFENRKKTNSPFVEYPLTRLDMVIKALLELKDYASTRGYYKEPTIYNLQYPESTTVNADDDKNTVLETLV